MWSKKKLLESVSGGAKTQLLLFFAFAGFSLTSCAPGIELEENAKNIFGDDGDDIDKDFDHPFNEGDDDLQTALCTSGEFKTEDFTLRPDAINGANVVLMLDDSGSMVQEFQKTIWNIQDFIDGINAVTSNNYRIVLIFDKTKQAIAGRSFTDNNGNPINDPNPFYAQIQNPNVFYFEKETFSKYADIAFARVFMPMNFVQMLPAIIPVDDPWTGPSVNPQDCAAPGNYFRPRNYTSNMYNTPGCVVAQDAVDISSVLLPNISVHVVGVSDDDLNVNFDRANYSWEDPTKNAYPEMVDLMFQGVFSGLGEGVSYEYHSIVGFTPGNGVALVGEAHMALSKKTGGARHSITTADWASLFTNLEDEIIFSAQRTDLACTPSSTLEVRFDGELVDPANYEVNGEQKRIQILPAAFDGYPSGQAIQVQVRYMPAE